MTPAIRPRWPRPRFSLRTLFALVTAIAIGLAWFLGWQSRIVRNRNEWIDTITTRGGGVYYFENMQGHRSPVPWYRAIFHDMPVAQIELYQNCAKSDREEVESLFPEAVITTDGHLARDHKF